MKFFLNFVAVFSLLFVSALNDTIIILDGFNKFASSVKSAEYFDDMLLDEKLSADKYEIGVEEDGNVKLIGGGPINLTLNELTFRLCTPCHGTIQICYESYAANSDLKGSCSPSQCQLKVHVENTLIKFGDNVDGAYMDIGRICDFLKIQDVESMFGLITKIPTCLPKIQNGMIHLFVKNAECPVKVVNAKIKYPEIPTTPLPSTPKPSDPNSEAAIPLWGIIVICILGVLLIVGFIIFGVYFYKKRQNSKKTTSPVEEPKQITVVAAEAKETVEPSSKTRPDLNFNKFEPGESRKSQKKVAVAKKEPTKEPTTTEEFIPTPPPKVTESAPPDPSKPEPKLPQGYYPFIPRIIPKSYKSLKTDSLEETIKKNKLTPVESVVDSLCRNSLKPSDSVVKEMKQKYPEIERPILQAETELLCVPVGEMYKKLNGMANGAEVNLTALGVQFDSGHRIVTMTSEGRKYLQNPKTPPTLVYFAFGAEFHEHITDDMNKMPKLSMAHLLVIAMQPRFEEYHRRKALTWLRRDLPKIRANYSASEREAFPFPVNAIEKAFVLDPKFLLSLSGIDTDSEGDRKRMAAAKKKKQAMKNIVGGDSKRKKKKSTKKRD